MIELSDKIQIEILEEIALKAETSDGNTQIIIDTPTICVAKTLSFFAAKMFLKTKH